MIYIYIPLIYVTHHISALPSRACQVDVKMLDSSERILRVNVRDMAKSSGKSMGQSLIEEVLQVFIAGNLSLKWIKIWRIMEVYSCES